MNEIVAEKDALGWRVAEETGYRVGIGDSEPLACCGHYPPGDGGSTGRRDCLDTSIVYADVRRVVPTCFLLGYVALPAQGGGCIWVDEQRWITHMGCRHGKCILDLY